MQNSSSVEQPAHTAEGSTRRSPCQHSAPGGSTSETLWEVAQPRLGAHPGAKWRGQASFHALHKLLEGRLRFEKQKSLVFPPESIFLVPAVPSPQSPNSGRVWDKADTLLHCPGSRKHSQGPG